MQLTTPIYPAMAVSTAINTLSNLPQSKEPLDLNEEIVVFDIVFTCLMVNV